MRRALPAASSSAEYSPVGISHAAAVVFSCVCGVVSGWCGFTEAQTDTAHI